MKQLVALALLVSGCLASVPRPNIFGDLDTARSSPAVRDAERRAPQAHAHAEQLRARAESAQQKRDTASAQILGEHAMAAYQRAVVLSRLAAAEARRGAAEARLAHSERQLQALDEQQKRVLLETESLELRARVLRDTLPLPSNAPAPLARERARLEASRALSLQARLLCASARLLEPGRPSLTRLLAELDQVDGRINKQSLPSPLDEATRLRSACLNELSLVRRPNTLSSPATSATDQLLEALSTASYEPARDDRGIAVTLRSAYAESGTLKEDSQRKLLALGRVAAEYRDFPVLVVLHTAENRDGDHGRKRVDEAAEILRRGGAQRIATALGGDAAPHVPPGRPGARERNERVEVVFVSPGSS